MPAESTRRRSLIAAVASLPIGVWPREPAPLRIGLTPVFLDERLRLLQRWREYLEATLATKVEFVQRSTYGQVMDVLLTGNVQFAWICGYPYSLHRRDLQLVAVPQWRGRPVYQSYLIAGTDVPAATVQDLRGRNFAYSDPLSNSGFLYMQHLLRRHTRDPSRFFSRSFFTHSHRYVVEAVAEGLAHAGAVDGYVWETLAGFAPQLTQRTRVLQRSPDFGFPPIVANGKVPPALAQRLAQALLSMADVPEGRAVLGELRLDRFVAGEAGLFAGIETMAREQARQSRA